MADRKFNNIAGAKVVSISGTTITFESGTVKNLPTTFPFVMTVYRAKTMLPIEDTTARVIKITAGSGTSYTFENVYPTSPANLDTGDYYALLGADAEFLNDIVSTDATTTAKGLMSAADKTKLDRLDVSQINNLTVSGQRLRLTYRDANNGENHIDATLPNSGSGGGNDGDDGQGLSIIYRREAATPTAPTGGTWNGTTFSAPTGWSKTVPTTPDEDLWVVVVKLLADHQNVEYSSVIKFTGEKGDKGDKGDTGAAGAAGGRGQAGTDGSDGDSTIFIWRRTSAATVPKPTANSGSYTNGTFTPPTSPARWYSTVAAATGSTRLWACPVKLDGDGSTYTYDNPFPVEGITTQSGGGGGTITGVTAGDGLTGGGTSGTVNLDVGAGQGITVDSDSITINLNGDTLTVSDDGVSVTVPYSTAEKAKLGRLNDTTVTAQEARAGTGTATRQWTPQRVAQAIAELTTDNFSAGTADPTGGKDGDYYIKIDSGNATHLWTRASGTWGSIAAFGTGSGGGGATNFNQLMGHIANNQIQDASIPTSKFSWRGEDVPFPSDIAAPSDNDVNGGAQTRVWTARYVRGHDAVHVSWQENTQAHFYHNTFHEGEANEVEIRYYTTDSAVYRNRYFISALHVPTGKVPNRVDVGHDETALTEIRDGTNQLIGWQSAILDPVPDRTHFINLAGTYTNVRYTDGTFAESQATQDKWISAYNTLQQMRDWLGLTDNADLYIGSTEPTTTTPDGQKEGDFYLLTTGGSNKIVRSVWYRNSTAWEQSAHFVTDYRQLTVHERDIPATKIHFPDDTAASNDPTDEQGRQTRLFAGEFTQGHETPHMSWQDHNGNRQYFLELNSGEASQVRMRYYRTGQNNVSYYNNRIVIENMTGNELPTGKVPQTIYVGNDSYNVSEYRDAQNEIASWRTDVLDPVPDRNHFISLAGVYNNIRYTDGTYALQPPSQDRWDSRYLTWQQTKDWLQVLGDLRYGDADPTDDTAGNVNGNAWIKTSGGDAQSLWKRASGTWTKAFDFNQDSGGGGGTGDITAVTTASGSGLTGGATSGDANIAVDVGNGIEITNNKVKIKLNGNTLTLGSSGISVSNPFTSAEKTKLRDIEANAKDDQTGAEMITAINAQTTGTIEGARLSPPSAANIVTTMDNPTDDSEKLDYNDLKNTPPHIPGGTHAGRDTSKDISNGTVIGTNTDFAHQGLAIVDGTLWALDNEAKRIVPFDPNTNTEKDGVSRISLQAGVNYSALASDGTNLYVLNHDDQAVNAYLVSDGSRQQTSDIASTVIKTPKSDTNIQAIAFAGDFLYAADQSNDSVYTYRYKNGTVAYLANRSLRGTQDVRSLVNGEAGHIQIAGLFSNGQSLGLVDSHRDIVYMFDITGTARPTREESLDFSQALIRSANENILPSGATTDGTTVWIANHHGGGVRSIYAFSLPTASNSVTPNELDNTLDSRLAAFRPDAFTTEGIFYHANPPDITDGDIIVNGGNQRTTDPIAPGLAGDVDGTNSSAMRALAAPLGIALEDNTNRFSTSRLLVKGMKRKVLDSGVTWVKDNIVYVTRRDNGGQNRTSYKTTNVLTQPSYQVGVVQKIENSGGHWVLWDFSGREILYPQTHDNNRGFIEVDGTKEVSLRGMAARGTGETRIGNITWLAESTSITAGSFHARAIETSNHEMRLRYRRGTDARVNAILGTTDGMDVGGKMRIRCQFPPLNSTTPQDIDIEYRLTSIAAVSGSSTDFEFVGIITNYSTGAFATAATLYPRLRDNTINPVFVTYIPATGAGQGGDIEAVIAGAGLTGGATSGDATLNVGAGDGITVNTDSITVDLDGSTLTKGTNGISVTSPYAASSVIGDINTQTSGTINQARVSGTLSTTDRTKFNGIEMGATADQTAAEIRDALVTLTGTNRLPASAVKDLPSGGGNGGGAVEGTFNQTEAWNSGGVNQPSNTYWNTQWAIPATGGSNGLFQFHFRGAHGLFTGLMSVDDLRALNQGTTTSTTGLGTLFGLLRLARTNDYKLLVNIPNAYWTSNQGGNRGIIYEIKPVAGGGGGLSSVETDDTIAGDGSTGSPLSITNKVGLTELKHAEQADFGKYYGVSDDGTPEFKTLPTGTGGLSTSTAFSQSTAAALNTTSGEFKEINWTIPADGLFQLEMDSNTDLTSPRISIVFSAKELRMLASAAEGDAINGTDNNLQVIAQTQGSAFALAYDLGRTTQNKLLISAIGTISAFTTHTFKILEYKALGIGMATTIKEEYEILYDGNLNLSSTFSPTSLDLDDITDKVLYISFGDNSSSAVSGQYGRDGDIHEFSVDELKARAPVSRTQTSADVADSSMGFLVNQGTSSNIQNNRFWIARTSTNIVMVSSEHDTDNAYPLTIYRKVFRLS